MSEQGKPWPPPDGLDKVFGYTQVGEGDEAVRVGAMLTKCPGVPWHSRPAVLHPKLGEPWVPTHWKADPPTRSPLEGEEDDPGVVFDNAETVPFAIRVCHSCLDYRKGGLLEEICHHPDCVFCRMKTPLLEWSTWREHLEPWKVGANDEGDRPDLSDDEPAKPPDRLRLLVSIMEHEAAISRLDGRCDAIADESVSLSRRLGKVEAAGEILENRVETLEDQVETLWNNQDPTRDLINLNYKRFRDLEERVDGLAERLSSAVIWRAAAEGSEKRAADLESHFETYRERPWPPPNDLLTIWGWHRRLGCWARVARSSRYGLAWEAGNWSEDYSHWRPEPPPPGDL